MSNGFKTYLLPRAPDLPEIELERQVTPSPSTLLGAKGAGEAGFGGAQAAIVNAVERRAARRSARGSTPPRPSPPNVLAAILGAAR